MPTSFTVASTADLNAALQQIDLGGGSSAPDTTYTISFCQDVTLTGQLYAINLASGDKLAIQGNGYALDGGGQYNGFFVYAGNVSIDDLAINHAKAVGGSGSGGGAGLGGGLFVASDGNVTLSSVTFSYGSAIGGNGALGNTAFLVTGGAASKAAAPARVVVEASGCRPARHRANTWEVRASSWALHPVAALAHFLEVRTAAPVPPPATRSSVAMAAAALAGAATAASTAATAASAAAAGQAASQA
ncbi:hypothetical protein [Methylobacterium tarhaniae]|uniref:hypothetical protein n=1 Tax=Methylobacterium tarhaniae TaxID=1187852 RepID=UPI003CFDA2AB